MNEIWSGSSSLAGDEDARAFTAIQPPPLVNAWWGLYVASTILGSIADKLGPDETLAPSDAGWLGPISDLLKIAAALTAVLLVHRVTAIQERALEQGSGRGLFGAGDSLAGAGG